MTRRSKQILISALKRLLATSVWSDRSTHSTTRTKICVYRSCVLSCLLYSSETCNTYRRHLKVWERVHQKFLRRNLNINWESLTPDTSVLERADISSIENIIIRNQLRWVGHLVRMKDERLPKCLFYGEFSIGKRPRNRPKKRFKDCIKSNLKATKIDINNLEEIATDRSRWRASVRSGCDSFEAERLANAKIKRVVRKGDIGRIPVNLRQQHVCDI